jgi:hypothetical protein
MDPAPLNDRLLDPKTGKIQSSAWRNWFGKAVYLFDQLSGGGNGTVSPSNSVTSETSYNQSANAGSSVTFSRGDHTHGTPSNANIPTVGQKAALAGTDGTPGANNAYVTNSDSRLSDSRTPTTHANSHSANGSDPLTLAQSQITGLAADLANKADKTTTITGLGLFANQGGDLSANRTFSLNNSDINHDALNNYSANHHVSNEEKEALAGSVGTPGANNAYVTVEDQKRLLTSVVGDVSVTPFYANGSETIVELSGSGTVYLANAANCANQAVIFTRGSGNMSIIDGNSTLIDYIAPALVIASSNGSSWGLVGAQHSNMHHAGSFDPIAPGDIGAATSGALSSHVSNTSNPHAVTAAQANAAPANKGVTNGDSHDHNGGDGAAITENALSLSDVSTYNSNSNMHGFLPKLSANTSEFLRGDANWAAPVGLVPVGAIIAWHKTLTGCPALPSSFAECNGQTLSDGDSPFNGQTIPNLNGEGRFLRGSNASGTVQADALQGHYHSIYDPGHHHLDQLRHFPANANYGTFGGDADIGDGNIDAITGYGNYTGITVLAASNDGSNGNPRLSNETRPINMSVVWVMRIK